MTDIVKFNPRPYTLGRHDPEFFSSRDDKLAELVYGEASASEARGILAGTLDYLQTIEDPARVLAELRNEIDNRSDPSSRWFQHINSGDLKKEAEFLVLEIYKVTL